MRPNQPTQFSTKLGASCPSKSTSSLFQPHEAPASPATPDSAPAAAAGAQRRGSFSRQSLTIEQIDILGNHDELQELRAARYLRNKNGVIVNGQEVTALNPNQLASYKDQKVYILYAFVEVCIGEQRRVIALPVQENLDSRHGSYAMFANINPNNIVNGGEIIFRTTENNRLEIFQWTDKTALFRTAAKNELTLHQVPFEDADENETLLMKAAGVAGHFFNLPREKFVGQKTWGELFGKPEEQSPITQKSQETVTHPLLKNKDGVYQFLPFTAHDLSLLALDRLSTEALDLLLNIAAELECSNPHLLGHK